MKIFFYILLFLFMVSCGGNPDTGTKDLPSGSEVENAIIKVNQYIAKRNRDHIKGFLRRTGWDMKQTGSGLWYHIEDKDNGENASSGNIISLDYRLLLVDGTLISSSAEDGRLQFRVGQGGVESGLEEAVRLMSAGDEAKLILPPHLAYGNFGKPEAGIPPDAILIYMIKVIEIK